MCKFVALEIDVVYSMSLTNIRCYDCGYMLDDTTEQLIYKGHTIHDGLVCDKFEYADAKSCPNCDDAKKYFMVVCADNPTLEIAYKMEVPIEQESI
jgi:RNA polymerase subunit RPABC4/transcription elongation factor Spt4